MAVALGAPPRALGGDFRWGNVQGLFDVTVSYGLAARTGDRDSELIGDPVNGGRGAAPGAINADDGNLNYDTGVISNMVKGAGQFSLDGDVFGLFARGMAFYDHEAEERDRERTQLDSDTLDVVGTDAELREHYVSARFRVKGIPVQFRVGDQILSWGRTTFVRSGVDVINPFDLVALFQPATLGQDVRVPQGMAWGAVILTENFAIEGFYQYEWTKTVLPPVGTYFSTNDLVGGDGPNFAMLGGGGISDLGTDLDAQFELPDGTLGFDPDFFKIPGRSEETASDTGQFGITLQGILPDTNATQLALHYVRYHARLPIVSSLTADQNAIDNTSPEAVAEEAAQLLPVYIGQGLSPVEAAAKSLDTAEQLALSEYANQAGYVIQYPEDIDLLGLSFSLATLRTGTLFTGEYSYNFDLPYQIDVGTVLNASLSPVQYDPDIGDTVLGEFGAEELVSGVAKLDTSQATLGITQFLGPRLRAAQITLGANFSWVHVHDMPGRNRLPLAGHRRPNADSWGYRLVIAAQYAGLFGGLTLVPRAVWTRDVDGTTPGPFHTFVEGRRIVNVGVTADYITRWSGDLSYTAFLGGGRSNLLRDRNFVRLNLTYSF